MNAMAHLFLPWASAPWSALLQQHRPRLPVHRLHDRRCRRLQHADFTHSFKVYQHEASPLGNLSLTVFLTCVLMSLKLWQLADLAVPLVVMLLSQALFMAIFAYFVVFRIMGRDYETS